jgi:hypothetical protein
MNNERFTWGIAIAVLFLMVLMLVYVTVSGVREKSLKRRIQALESFRASAEGETLVITIDPKYGELISVQNFAKESVKLESFSAISENGVWIARWQTKKP